MHDVVKSIFYDINYSELYNLIVTDKNNYIELMTLYKDRNIFGLFKRFEFCYGNGEQIRKDFFTKFIIPFLHNEMVNTHSYNIFEDEYLSPVIHYVERDIRKNIVNHLDNNVLCNILDLGAKAYFDSDNYKKLLDIVILKFIEFTKKITLYFTNGRMFHRKTDVKIKLHRLLKDDTVNTKNFLYLLFDYAAMILLQAYYLELNTVPALHRKDLQYIKLDAEMFYLRNIRAICDTCTFLENVDIELGRLDSNELNGRKDIVLNHIEANLRYFAQSQTDMNILLTTINDIRKINICTKERPIIVCQEECEKIKSKVNFLREKIKENRNIKLKQMENLYGYDAINELKEKINELQIQSCSPIFREKILDIRRAGC